MLPKEPEFVAPYICLGDTVVWSHSAEDIAGDNAAAVVVKVGTGGAVSLFVIPPDARQGSIKDGVLHADDPRNRLRAGESGVWRHTARLAATLRALADNLAPTA